MNIMSPENMPKGEDNGGQKKEMVSQERAIEAMRNVTDLEKLDEILRDYSSHTPHPDEWLKRLWRIYNYLDPSEIETKEKLKRLELMYAIEYAIASSYDASSRYEALYSDKGFFDRHGDFLETPLKEHIAKLKDPKIEKVLLQKKLELDTFWEKEKSGGSSWF